MESSDRKAEILDVSMKMVCEYGLSFFTTKKVAVHMGISESLIYKYFPSKEILLYSCFEVMHKKIAALMENLLRLPQNSDMSETGFIKQLWVSYFNLLVEEDYRTIFYFVYRDSTYIKTILQHNDEAIGSYFKDFAALIGAFDEKYKIFSRINSHFLWTYILDTTGMFAKRTIMGDLPKNNESTETIWKLIFSGISGILNM